MLRLSRPLNVALELQSALLCRVQLPLRHSSQSAPDSIDTIICGSGVIGSSIAYHLAQRGHGPKTLLLELPPSLMARSVAVEINSAGQPALCDVQSPTTTTMSDPSPAVSQVGLVSALLPNRQQSHLVACSQRLYRRLHERGHSLGLTASGSVHVARSAQRLHHFRRQCAVLRDVLGVEAVMLPAEEVHQRCLLLTGTRRPVLGGIWLPSDLSVSPPLVASTLQMLSERAGVRILRSSDGSGIERVLTSDEVLTRPSVTGIRLTDGSTIACRRLVNAAASWSRNLAQLSRPIVRLPVLACEHYSLNTRAHEPWQFSDATVPILCDPSSRLTVRLVENDGRLIAGGFELVCRPVGCAREEATIGGGGLGGGGSFPTSSATRFQWQRLHAAVLSELLECVPAAGETFLARAQVTPESYTPDGHWMLGQCGEIGGYFVAAGLGAHGTAAAGGVGALMASWILDSGASPPIDVHQMDVRRFLALHNNGEFLRKRMCEVPAQFVGVPWSFSEYESGRRLRTSPIFSRLGDSGAHFGAVMGYERPAFFDTQRFGAPDMAPSADPLSSTSLPAASSTSPTYNDIANDSQLNNLSTSFSAASTVESETSSITEDASPNFTETSGDTPHKMGTDTVAGPAFRICRTNTFHCPPWFHSVAEEYRACRERVAISDYSSFTKIDLISRGDEVVRYLQRLCSNDIDIAIGNIAHTGMQNVRGGYENDCSLARLAASHYMMICPTVQHARCQWWLRQHLPDDGSVVVNDVTSLYTALCVMGPLARELLAELTPTDLQPRNFPFFTFKEIDIGMVSGIRAMNMTHTGELGWVLYVPNEFALYVYNLLKERGRDYGMGLAGYFAMRSLRVEKFYAFWGQDLGTVSTPLECGRAFRVKFAKDIDFIGRRALERQREEGVRKLYVHFVVYDHNPHTDPWPWGSEPIYRDGKLAGIVTTSSFGFSLGRMVCLGFVQDLNTPKSHDPARYVTPSSSSGNDFRSQYGGVFDSATANVVTNEFVLRGQYQIRIGDRLFPVKPSLVSPSLASRSHEPNQKRYQPTQHTTL